MRWSREHDQRGLLERPLTLSIPGESGQCGLLTWPAGVRLDFEHAPTRHHRRGKIPQCPAFTLRLLIWKAVEKLTIWLDGGGCNRPNNDPVSQTELANEPLHTFMFL